MAIQNRERLRQLVGDYYQGLITAESYRAQRGQLLDNIGATIDEEFDSTTAPRQPAKTTVTPTAESGPTSPGVPVSGLASYKGAIIGVAIVAVVAVGYFLASQVFLSDAAPGIDAVEEVPAAGRDLASGDQLIDEFLSRNDWADDSLSNFLLAWGALDDDQRQLAREGRRYRLLTNVLHRRIREEAALGTAPGTGRLASLAGFAATMDIPYRESVAPAVDEALQADAAPEAEPIVETQQPDESDSLVTDTESLPPMATEETPVEPDDAETSPAADAETPIVADPPDPEEAATANTESALRPDDPCPATIANTRRPYCQDVLADGSNGPSLVVLPTGTFDMGNDRVDSEAPVRRVEISYNIAMSRFEVTADEYAQYCAATSLPCPVAPWTEDHPVVSVSWDDAVSYTEWLSETTTFRYRLPSEAEWEFAARGGTQSPYYFGDEITPSAALSSVNGPVDAPVPKSDRTINRNPFRLYHMSGNVREWTLDSWYPNYEDAGSDGSARMNDTEPSKVVRGGSYSDPGDRLRSAARESVERAHRDTMTGFRVVREVVATKR